jgi:DNA-binding GntR family transcriptional regulator
MKGTPGTERAGRRGRPRLTAEGLDLGQSTPEPGTPLYDHVYDELCRAIMAGAVLPGQQLSARSIAEALGTSVTPAKEALRRLTADGVLFALAKSAFRVTPMTVARYTELLDIRKRLEGFAAEEACRNADASLIARLEALNAAFARAPFGQPAGILAINLDFHFTLYGAAAKPDLLRIIKGLWLRIGPYLSLFEWTDTDDSVGTHAAIIEALRRRDPEAVSRAVCRDLDDAATSILARLAQIEGAAARLDDTAPKPAAARRPS